MSIFGKMCLTNISSVMVKSHVKQQMSWLYFHQEAGKFGAGILPVQNFVYHVIRNIRKISGSSGN